MNLIKKSYFQLFFTLIFIFNAFPCDSAEYRIKADNDSRFSIMFKYSMSFSNAGTIQKLICKPTIELKQKSDIYFSLCLKSNFEKKYIFEDKKEINDKSLTIVLIFSKGLREFFKKNAIDRKIIVIENIKSNNIQEIVNNYLLVSLIKDSIDKQIIGSEFNESNHNIAFYIALQDESFALAPNDNSIILLVLIIIILLVLIISIYLVYYCIKLIRLRKPKIIDNEINTDNWIYP